MQIYKLIQILNPMGNQLNKKKENANSVGNKIVLSLRYREIILHNAFKMKLGITDISLFPHGLERLRLWDLDVILSRFIILQNEKFANKHVFVFKGGVGIGGITLSKWTGCKQIDMCDTRPEVLGNMLKNCERNGVKNVKCFEINLAQFDKYTQTYDFALATDLLSQGFQPQAIMNVWRKILKVGGESIMIMPQNKEQAKKLLQIVDKSEFKISNIVLNAQEYEASPLVNKLQSQSEFPLIAKSQFYAITLTKLKESAVETTKHGSQSKQTGLTHQSKFQYTTPIRGEKTKKQKQEGNLAKQESKQVAKFESNKQITEKSPKLSSIPITIERRNQEIKEQGESPIKKIQFNKNGQIKLLPSQPEQLKELNKIQGFPKSQSNSENVQQQEKKDIQKERSQNLESSQPKSQGL